MFNTRNEHQRWHADVRCVRRSPGKSRSSGDRMPPAKDNVDLDSTQYSHHGKLQPKQTAYLYIAAIVESFANVNWRIENDDEGRDEAAQLLKYDQKIRRPERLWANFVHAVVSYANMAAIVGGWPSRELSRFSEAAGSRVEIDCVARQPRRGLSLL